MVRQTNCEAVTLERDGQIREFKPSAKGKWDALVSSMMQVSVGDQIRVTGEFREGKNVFKNNDIAQVRESPVPGLSCMTAGECAVMVLASIKAPALPLMRASAVRSSAAGQR